MLFSPRPFLYLDAIHLLTLLALIPLAGYLLTSSLSAKQSDCHGIYNLCLSRDQLAKLSSSSRLFQLSTTDDSWKDNFRLAARLSARVGDSSSPKRDQDRLASVFLVPNSDKKVAHTSQQQSIPTSQPESNSSLDGQSGVSKVFWNLDWIALSQYVNLAVLLVVTALGSTAALLRGRKLILIAILLHLVHLVQLVLIESSDDRDFPASLFRDERALAKYSLLYTINTNSQLVLKGLLLVLLLLYYIELVVYFATLRYNRFYAFAPAN